MRLPDTRTDCHRHQISHHNGAAYGSIYASTMHVAKVLCFSVIISDTVAAMLQRVGLLFNVATMTF